MVKDWVGNNKSIFKQLGASNHSSEEREENDFYATDPKAIDELLKRETFNKSIWECAVGQGHLAERLKEYGYSVRCSDIVDRGYSNTELVDFLFEFDEFDGDIITNPPYKLCSEFILKALDLIPTGNKVAMFLKLQTLEGGARYEQIYKHNPPKTIYVFVKRIQCAKNGTFTGSSAVCYAWFVWEKGFKGEPIIRWI